MEVVHPVCNVGSEPAMIFAHSYECRTRCGCRKLLGGNAARITSHGQRARWLAAWPWWCARLTPRSHEMVLPALACFSRRPCRPPPSHSSETSVQGKLPGRQDGREGVADERESSGLSGGGARALSEDIARRRVRWPGAVGGRTSGLGSPRPGSGRCSAAERRRAPATASGDAAQRALRSATEEETARRAVERRETSGTHVVQATPGCELNPELRKR